MSTEQTPPTAEELAAWERDRPFTHREGCACHHCKRHERLVRVLAALRAERERVEERDALIEAVRILLGVETAGDILPSLTRLSASIDRTAAMAKALERAVRDVTANAARTPEPRDA